MTQELPPPGSNGVESHTAMSRRFIDHARDELDRGDRLQASEKLWGAVAHALKAIAIRRGWDHDKHRQIHNIAIQLGHEFGRPDFETKIRIANSFHEKFYENEEQEDSIGWAIGEVDSFISDLDEVRAAEPRPYTIPNESDRNRVGQLLGLRRSERPEIGAHSEVGFSKTHSQNKEES